MVSDYKWRIKMQSKVFYMYVHQVHIALLDIVGKVKFEKNSIANRYRFYWWRANNWIQYKRCLSGCQKSVNSGLSKRLCLVLLHYKCDKVSVKHDFDEGIYKTIDSVTLSFKNFQIKNICFVKLAVLSELIDDVKTIQLIQLHKLAYWSYKICER